MKVTQIASILNAVYGELLGGETIPNPNYNPEATEDASNPKVIANPNLFKEDLSNVVDVGAKITSSSTWGNNFDKYVGKIIDKVGRVIFRDRVYSGDSLGLRREAQDYGSVVEKLRVEVGDFKLNNKWRMTAGNVLPDGTAIGGSYYLDANGKPVKNTANDATKGPDYSHLFDFDEPAEVEALYFNILDTYKLTICLPKDQMEGAFRGASDMQRFFGMITNRIMTKFEVALEALDEAAEANFIGAKIYYQGQGYSGARVVDLLAAYNAGPNAGGTPLTKAAALENEAFLRWCVRRIKTDKKLMARFSGKYNIGDASDASKGGYGTFTPADRLKVFALTDFATAIETVLRSQTYHDNFVALDGYKEVPYWQASSDDDFDSRSSINAKVVVHMSGLGKVESSDIKDVSRSGIVFVMQDVDAVMTGSTQMDVDNLYNPDGRFWKYFYGHDMRFYNDLSENAIIYTLGTDAAPVGAMDGTLTLAKGATNGTTIPTVSIEGATSYKGAVTDAPLAIGIGYAAPSALSTTITSGTTELSATAGQYVNIAGIKSSKVVGVVQKPVTAEVIK